MLILVLVYKWADSFIVTSPICEVMQSKEAVSRQSAVKDGTHHGARLPSVCIYNCLIACLLFWPTFLLQKGRDTKARKCGAKAQNMSEDSTRNHQRLSNAERIPTPEPGGERKARTARGSKIALNLSIFYITWTTKRIHFIKMWHLEW